MGGGAAPSSCSRTTTRSGACPSHDDRHLFEMLTLEGAQAGLSWNTILNKREGYRRAFAGFDPEAVARFGPKDVERLLADPGIVRNRLKVESTVDERAPASSRCRRSTAASTPTCGRFVDGAPIVGNWRSLAGAPGGDRALEGALEGPEEARLPLRRADGLLRVHAGRRPGQRPHRRLLPLRRAGALGARGGRYARVVTAIRSARLTSWIARRIARHALVVGSLGALLPELVRGRRAAPAIRSDASTCPSRSRDAFTASPSAPIASRWRVHSIGTAIEMYWWMRANVSGWTSDVARAARQRGSGSSVGDPPCVLAEHAAQLAVVEAGERRGADRRRAASSAGGRTGSRRRTRPAPAARCRKRSSRSSALQTEVSKKTPGIPPSRPASPAMSAIPACATISRTPSMRRTSRLEMLGDRRQPAAAVDEDRHRALEREREDRLEPLVVERERLRARVELDPARAEVERAPRLLERARRQVEADERERASRPSGSRARACGRSARRSRARGRARRGRRRTRPRMP